MSASAFKMDERKSQLAGCDAFLPKPITIETLTQTIGDLLGLEWQLEERQAAPPTEEGDLIPPERHELEVLYELAMFGDMEQIQKRVLYLIKIDPQYAPFANKLLRWAQDFEDEQILGLLKQLLASEE